MYRVAVKRALRADCGSKMKRAGLFVLAGTIAAAALAAVAQPGVQRRQDTGYRSEALGGTLHFEVYLPAGYDTSGLRYPVVYFLHGLPAGTGAYRSLGFVEHALDAVGQPAILVAPQGARPRDADPEYVDQGPMRGWGTAIAAELPRVYVGRDDWRFVDENIQLNRELSRAGIRHVFRLYPGGHEQALWQRHAPAWLALALAHLAPAR